jgi:hypothetical protein
VEGRTGLFEFKGLIIGSSLLLIAFLLFKPCWNLLKNVDKAFSELKKEFLMHPRVLLCVSWIAPYLLFLFFFIPGNTFYRLFYLPAIIILLALFLTVYKTNRTNLGQWKLLFAVGIIFLSNFIFFIYPYSLVRKNTALFFAKHISSPWSSEKTIVYYDKLSFYTLTVRYFTPSAEWKPLNTDDVKGGIETDLQKVANQGGSVWIEKSAIETLNSSGQTAEWLKSNSIETKNYELQDAAYNLKFVKLKP